MKSFPIPGNLNGSELIDELLSNGVNINDYPDSYRNKKPPKIEDGLLWLDISEKDEAKAAAVVAAHNGTTVAPEPTIEQKLASVGLTIDDLKSALGI